MLLREVPQHFGRTVRNQNIALLAKWAVQTQDNIITYVRNGIRTNKNRGKQCKTHGKYRTVANMQSKSKVYIFRPFTDLGTPPHPPRVWKIGILQEMSRNSIIPDIDRDNSFTVFFQHVYCIVIVCSYQSLRFPPCSNRFCTLYSGCYHIFLPGCYHIFLHCIFPAFSSGFCTISSDCYHVFLQFLYPLRGF